MEYFRIYQRQDCFQEFIRFFIIFSFSIIFLAVRYTKQNLSLKCKVLKTLHVLKLFSIN